WSLHRARPTTPPYPRPLTGVLEPVDPAAHALDEDLDAVARGALHGHGRRIAVVDDVRLYRADTLLGVDHVDDAIGGDVTEPDEQLRRPVPDVRHDHLVGELDDARRGGRVVGVVLDPVGAGTGEVEAAQEHGH